MSAQCGSKEGGDTDKYTDGDGNLHRFRVPHTSATRMSRPPPTSPLNGPVPLLQYEGGRWRIDKEGRDLLHGVRGPVTVIGIAGPMREGKSFVMSRIAGAQDLFEMGHTTESCTRGIWIYVTDRYTDSGARVVLLDTEGMNDTVRCDPNFDAQVFMLTLLLSSVLVYNVMKTLHENCFELLHCVTQLTRHLRSGLHGGGVAGGGGGEDEEDGTSYGLFFPVLVWLVRDFQLGLSDGVASADEWLESVLSPRPKGNAGAGEANDIRDCLRAFFPECHCRCLSRPVNSDDDLKRVEKLPYEALRPAFREEIEDAIGLILSLARAKRVLSPPGAGAAGSRGSDVEVDGPALIEYLDELVTGLNDGRAISVAGAWTRVSERALQVAWDRAVALHGQFLTQARNAIPMADEVAADMERRQATAQEAAIGLFHAECAGTHAQVVRPWAAEPVAAPALTRKPVPRSMGNKWSCCECCTTNGAE